jgi:hypothetical protein
MTDRHRIIQQTQNWIEQVVIGCNFCPFAAKEVRNDTIHYEVVEAVEMAAVLEALLIECGRLDQQPAIETSFLIFPDAFEDFNEYLTLVELAEQLLRKNRYEGIYQLASFHPRYIFEGSDEGDAANYTNRSVYPMLHLLREESIEKVLEKYPDPENIPERNVRFAREKGIDYMRALWEKTKEMNEKSPNRPLS